jgi:hypothetical protein
MQIERSKKYLYRLNNEIARSRKPLSDYNMFCKLKTQQLENINSEISRILTLVNRFKNNNKEYLKIKQTAEEKVKDVITNRKLLLKFATFSVIESLRSNPELYNFVVHDNSNNTTMRYGSNYPSLMLSGQQQQQLFNDRYAALV